MSPNRSLALLVPEYLLLREEPKMTQETTVKEMVVLLNQLVVEELVDSGLTL